MAKLHYAEYATKAGGVIENSRVERVGSKGSTHFVFTVYFKDGTWYEDDCTARDGNLAYGHIWADKGQCEEITQNAILAHFGAAEINEYKKSSKGEKNSHKAKVAYAVEYALNHNEMRWDYCPLGIKQADYIITQFAEILRMNLEQYNKDGYHKIFNLYLVLYTKIKLFNKSDEDVIRELLRSYRSDIPGIPSEENANQILALAKSQIENPSVPSEAISENRENDKKTVNTNLTKKEYAPNNSVTANDTLFAKLNNIEKMIEAGGNFAFIAQNIATIYCVVKESDVGKQFNEEQTLYATTLFDLMAYINDQEIKISEISDIVNEGLSLAKILPDNQGNAKLIGVALKTEQKCFELSTNVDISTINNQVVGQLDIISDVIKAILLDPEKSSIYKNVFENVTNWLNNSTLIKYIIEFKGTGEHTSTEDTKNNSAFSNEEVRQDKPEDKETVLEYNFANQDEFIIYILTHKDSIQNDKLVWTKGNQYMAAYNKGYALFENRQYSAAMTAYKESLECNPVGLAARFEIIECLIQLGRNIEAKETLLGDLITYAQYNSSSLAKAYRRLGFIYTEQKKYNLAKASFLYSYKIEKNDTVVDELRYIMSVSGDKNLDIDINSLLGNDKVPLLVVSNIYDQLEQKQTDNESVKYKLAQQPEAPGKGIEVKDENASEEKETAEIWNKPSVVGKIMAEKRSEIEDHKEKEKGTDEETIEYIFCRKCGRKLPADSDFCTYCGTAVVRIV